MLVINGQATAFSINAGNSRANRTFHYRLLKADMTALTSFTATGVSEALQNDDSTPTGSYGVTITITDVLTRFIQWRDTSDDRCWISEITISDDWVTDVKRLLGLVHENVYFDNPTYDGVGNLATMRMRTYSVAGSVGTGSDVLATYNVTVTAAGQLGKFVTFKMVKA